MQAIACFKLFVAVVSLARELGLANFGKLSIDGAKVRANASKRKAMSYARMQAEEKRLAAEIEQLLQRARDTDAEEDARFGESLRGDELPQGLRRREDRLKAIQEAKQRLEAAQQAADDARGRQPGQKRNPKGGKPYQRDYGEPKASARDLKQPPVYIMGAAMGGGPLPGYASGFPGQAPEPAEAAAKYFSKRLYEMAGVTPGDMDFAEIYDCFTFAVIYQLEGYGFCKEGEGGPFVEDGRIELGGQLPVNTHGGQLSDGYFWSMSHLVEAVQQLRGHAGARQVRDAEIGLVTGHTAQVGSAEIVAIFHGYQSTASTTLSMLSRSQFRLGRVAV